MSNHIGQITVGSYDVWPSARLDPMPWSVRNLAPWGYFEQNTPIQESRGTWTAGNVALEGNVHESSPSEFRNIVKPLIGFVHITAYDVEHRPTTTPTFVPEGSKVYVDGIEVATVGNVGEAYFTMHANDPHVIRVEMIDPYWGLPYTSFAEMTQTVALDGELNLVFYVPRARYEPWDYNITVQSKTGAGAYAPASADVYVNGVLTATTDVDGHARVSALDDQEHSYIVVVHDNNVVEGETYRVSAACTYGNSSCVATMIGTPPRFDFKSELQYIYDFSISPTTRLLDLVETGSFFNHEALTITPVYTGNIVSVAYEITSSAGVDTHVSNSAPFVWVWTPNSTSTPDTVVINAVFTDDTGATGTYYENFVIHTRHQHVVTALNASINHPIPLPIQNASVYVDNVFVGNTDVNGQYTVAFNDENTHTVRVTAENQEGGTGTQSVTHSLVSGFDQVSNHTYSFAWQVQNRPPVVTFVGHGLGAKDRAYELEATATDIDGAIARVSFYVNAVFVGSKLTAPYVVNWIPSTTGTHAITVVAVDDSGASGSDSGTVQVSIAPTITTNAQSVVVVGTDNNVIARVVSIGGVPDVEISFDALPITYTGPVQVAANTYEYAFVLSSPIVQHADLVVVATSTEGLSTTYVKNIFVASSYLPKVVVTTKLAGPEYDVPVPVSADILVDDVPVGYTDSSDGKLIVNLPDDGPHKITAHYVPADLYLWTIFSSGYGTVTVLQDFVFSLPVEEEIVVDTVPELPKPYSGLVHIEPLFGAEKDSYLRILYGSETTRGVTPGRFWDMRSLPLPYRALTKTDFNVIIDPDGVGSLFRIKILRENPTEVPTTDVFDFVAESTEHVISIYLGRGLNVFDIYAFSNGDFRRIASSSYVSSHYATVLYTHAVSITRFIHTPLAQIDLDIRSESSTTVVSPVISFDSELPESSNLARSARQRIVSVMMNQSTSSLALDVFGGSLFQQTLLKSRPVFDSGLDINSAWLLPMHTQSQTHNSHEVHVWQLDREIARWALLPKLLASSGNLEKHGLASTTSSRNDVAEWKSVTKTYNPKHPDKMESWWEVSIESEIDYDLFPHTRPNSRILYPGLWDSGEIPFFDQNQVFDSGKAWDSGDASGDIVLDGFIGTPVTGERSWNLLPEIGVSVLDRCVETITITNTYTMNSFVYE